jgi:hypothetical protein
VRAVGSQLGSHPSIANALTAARLREVFGQDRALSDADAELLAATACMAHAAGLDAPVRRIWGPTGAAAVLAGRQCPLLSVILRWNVAQGHDLEGASCRRGFQWSRTNRVNGKAGGRG